MLSVLFGFGIVISRIIQNSTTTGNKAGLDSFIFGKTAGMIAQDVYLIALVCVIGILLLIALFKEFKLVYPSLHDGSGDYADALGTSGVPENFLIDPEGKVAAVLAGAITEEWLTGTVAPLIEGEETS